MKVTRRVRQDLPREIRQTLKEKPLAWAMSTHGWVIGTRTRLVGPQFDLAWSEIEKADWDRGSDQLRVVEVGTFGQPRGVHVITMAEPGHLLELVRERITASVVLQRRVRVDAKRGFWVIARRTQDGSLRWLVEYDASVDPHDAHVQALAETGLAAARSEVGGLS